MFCGEVALGGTSCMFVVALRAKKRIPTRTTTATATELVMKERKLAGSPKNGLASGLTEARKSGRCGSDASIR
jgi:hypothetical protein